MTILDKIVNSKRKELIETKKRVTLSMLEKSRYFERETFSLKKSLSDFGNYGIIAEFKRRSPSRGIINHHATPEIVCNEYFKHGASAISILTNRDYFGGSNNDVINVRDLCNGPILRKEFIIDDYQVVESKSIGADAILLIADILTRDELANLFSLAASLKMEALIEIHDKSGVSKLPAGAGITGINSRNLKTFSVNSEKLIDTIKLLPEDVLKIAESGIASVENIIELSRVGFDGFLIGELFMKNNSPGKALGEFINMIKNENKSLRNNQ